MTLSLVRHVQFFKIISCDSGAIEFLNWPYTSRKKLPRKEKRFLTAARNRYERCEETRSHEVNSKLHGPISTVGNLKFSSSYQPCFLFSHDAIFH